MNPLISKARRPKFDLTLKIIDLNNVPLVTGTSFIKWHLPSSTSAEHRGRTEREPVVEHKVSWEYTRHIPVRLTIDKLSNLSECLINFEVVQDYSSNVRGEKITLGYVSLNLAEYVEESELGAEGEDGVVRRYLMQESKINSTLKIGISMKQVDGERNFVAPPLKTAPVFGGIAGIMAGEQNDQDEIGMAMPTINRSRDQGELQDMYRRALAASWAATSGELPADQCVEDIFNGGDGFGDRGSKPRLGPQTHFEDDLNNEHQHRHHHHRTNSGASAKSESTVKTKGTGLSGGRKGHKHKDSSETIGISPGMTGGDSASSDGISDRGRTGFRRVQEVDEFVIRDDLIAWRLPNQVF